MLSKGVLADLCNEEWSGSAYSSAHSDGSGFELPSIESTPDSRVVSVKTPRASTKIKSWQLGSKELDLHSWTLARNNKRPVKERIENPNTYASRLKGPAPGPSAKPLEQPLRFLKRNNIVKR